MNIDINHKNLKALKEAHEIAIEGNNASFMLDGREYDTQFAKYLIQYMSDMLPVPDY
jgi:hypothetical protein